jgi:hypothetical protein
MVGHNDCSFDPCAKPERDTVTPRKEGGGRSRYLFQVRTLPRLAGGEPLRRGDETKLSKVRPAHTGAAASGSGYRRRCANGRTSAQAERERIATPRGYRLHQPVEHSAAPLEVAVAHAQRAQRGTGKRIGWEKSVKDAASVSPGQREASSFADKRFGGSVARQGGSDAPRTMLESCPENFRGH